MKEQLLNGLRAEGPLFKQAAHNVAAHAPNAGGKLKEASLAFKESSTTNKLAVISGGITGITFTLQGIKTIKSGLKKDEEGKRDLSGAAVGATQLLGGVVMASLFYERMKLNSSDFGSRER